MKIAEGIRWINSMTEIFRRKAFAISSSVSVSLDTRVIMAIRELSFSTVDSDAFANDECICKEGAASLILILKVVVLITPEWDDSSLRNQVRSSCAK